MNILSEAEAHRRLGRPQRTGAEQVRRDVADTRRRLDWEHAQVMRSLPRLIEESRLKQSLQGPDGQRRLEEALAAEAVRKLRLTAGVRR